MLVLRCAARSDVGRRANNEDTVLGSPRLAAVADGVGGEAGGEVASRLVVHALVALEKRRLEGPLEIALTEAVRWGNDALAFVTACRPELAGLSTTLTAVALDDDGRYLIANVGDSRTYLFRAGRLTQLTRDGSLVQALIDRGAISPEQARRHPQRSVVTEALDGRAREAIALARVRACAGDRLLLCSDGLSDTLADAAIAAALAEPARAAAADRLVAEALRAGARDNVSVVVADVRRGEGSAAGWRGPEVA